LVHNTKLVCSVPNIQLEVAVFQVVDNAYYVVGYITGVTVCLQ